MAETLDYLNSWEIAEERCGDHRRSREDELGRWRPSPGSIYPLLDQMTVEGAITKLDDGRYELTEKGKDEGSFPFGFPFGQRPTSLESMVNEMRDYVSYFEDLASTSSSKLDQYKTRLKEVVDRLSKLLQ